MAIIRANNNTLSSVTALPDAISTGGLVHLGGTTASGQSSVDFTETLGHIDFKKILAGELES